MASPIAEGESEIITNPEALVAVTTGAGLIEKWLERDPENALKRIEALVTLLDRLRVLSIKATYPSDWLIHVSVDADGTIIREVGYLQDCGAERASKPWGISITRPSIEREDFPDQTFAYHMQAEAHSAITGENLEYVEGSRWSGDSFFKKALGPDDKPDPVDLRKSAYTNLHGRAVRQLAGLNAVQLDKLRDAGLDITKVVRISYTKGAKGGESTGASVGSADVTMAWGKGKGKKVSDLDDKEITYYIGTYVRDVADPDKAKYLKNNQRTLDALKTEQEKRTRTAEQGAEAPAGEAKEPTLTAEQVTEFWKLAKAHGWDVPDVETFLGQEGWKSVDNIPLKAWETVKVVIGKPPVKTA